MNRSAGNRGLTVVIGDIIGKKVGPAKGQSLQAIDFENQILVILYQRVVVDGQRDLDGRRAVGDLNALGLPTAEIGRGSVAPSVEQRDAKRPRSLDRCHIAKVDRDKSPASVFGNGFETRTKGNAAQVTGHNTAAVGNIAQRGCIAVGQFAVTSGGKVKGQRGRTALQNNKTHIKEQSIHIDGVGVKPTGPKLGTAVRKIRTEIVKVSAVTNK